MRKNNQSRDFKEEALQNVQQKFPSFLLKCRQRQEAKRAMGHGTPRSSKVQEHLFPRNQESGSPQLRPGALN